MTTIRFTVAVAATLMFPSIAAKAESGGGKVKLVSYAHAVHLHPGGTSSYVQTGGCKYIGPYGPYVDCSYDVSCAGCHPFNPCCGTIFSEMFCDILAHLHGLFTCQWYCCDETLGECCGVEAYQSPRLRDYLPCDRCHGCDACGGLVGWLFSPLWGGYCDRCGDGIDYGYPTEILDDEETIEPGRPALEPVPEPARTPRPATPVPTAGTARGRMARRTAATEPNRLRSYVVARESSRRRPTVRRSDFREAIVTAGKTSRSTPRAVRPAGKVVSDVVMTPEQAEPSGRAAAKNSPEPRADARLRVTYGPPVHSQMIRFGDQFGKTSRSRFGGVEFR